MTGRTIQESIFQDHEEKQRLWKQYLDLKQEAARKAKYSKIFAWMGVGTGVIGASVLLGGGIAAAVGTGGLAIPAILAAAGGLAAVAGGGTEIASSALKFLGNKSAGESFEMKAKSDLKKDEIVSKIQDMEQNDNSISQLWGNIAQLLRNTPKNMFR